MRLMVILMAKILISSVLSASPLGTGTAVHVCVYKVLYQVQYTTSISSMCHIHVHKMYHRSIMYNVPGLLVEQQ